MSDLKEASENWWHSFAHSGSCVADCSCGRTVWAGGFDLGWDEGEHERLVELTASKPDQFICIHDDTGVSIAATGHVWGCACGGAAKVQDFLDAHRLDILAYFKKERDDELRQSKILSDAVDGACP